ncbi:MAG: hypothetical protein H7249_09800 [Chitinophagaceae bacterium]|nr:hypothetical protein [Oligoflexus sp.]
MTISAADSELLIGIQTNTYIPWCFDALKGRGALKQMSLSLHWSPDGTPHLSLGAKQLVTRQDETDILTCLDASLKEFPPKHSLDHDVLDFGFVRSRKQ